MLGGAIKTDKDLSPKKFFKLSAPTTSTSNIMLLFSIKELTSDLRVPYKVSL